MCGEHAGETEEAPEVHLECVEIDFREFGMPDGGNWSVRQKTLFFSGHEEQ